MRIWNLNGSKSLAITEEEGILVRGMLNLLALDPTDTEFLPEGFCLSLRGRRIPLRKISLEKPKLSENSELSLDI